MLPTILTLINLMFLSLPINSNPISNNITTITMNTFNHQFKLLGSNFELIIAGFTIILLQITISI